MYLKWYNERLGYDCVSDKDFEKYERIIGFTNNNGNSDVSLIIQGFASHGHDISKNRYAFHCDVNMPRGGKDWIQTLEIMKEIIEKELNYSKNRIGKSYIPESTRRSCYKN